ncbi:pseudouridine-5'-phosphate glycosidase [Isosphaeraceae bacterium EP7]
MRAIRNEVRDAIAAGQGVVALESTLVAHGLPWPDNLETALDSEAAVRAAGSIPATVAIVGGRLTIGLSRPEIEAMARSNTYLKASRRDLALAVARGLNAATTVSATLWAARTSGLGVMATGGLGGVHRGAAESFDVSADLDELARADGCLLVCSGVKSILDVAATLEALETRGVAVLGYRADEFPAFTARSSGLPVEHRLDDPTSVAEVVAAHRALGLPGALLLARPVDEEVAVDQASMDLAIEGALREAHSGGIRGKAITPFLLGKVRELTEGRSLGANRSLIVANAGLAGEIAAALASRRTAI